MALFGGRDIKNLDQKVQAGRSSLDVAATIGPDRLTSVLSNIGNELFAAANPLAAKGRGADAIARLEEAKSYGAAGTDLVWDKIVDVVISEIRKT